MDLTASNVIKSLSEIAPYIEADGGFVEFVEIEEGTNYVKVRLGGACTSCAMSALLTLIKAGPSASRNVERTPLHLAQTSARVLNSVPTRPFKQATKRPAQVESI